MGDTIIVEVELVNTCIGLVARFWKGEEILQESGLKKVVDSMAGITARYKNRENKDVLFAVRRR